MSVSVCDEWVCGRQPNGEERAWHKCTGRDCGVELERVAGQRFGTEGAQEVGRDSQHAGFCEGEA